MQHALTALGKDAVSFMAADEFPLPYEYRFLKLDRLVTVPPEDLEQRTIVFLDCGNIDRNPADVLKREGAHIVNVDHHHDNTCFGTVNHVDPTASSTAEMVWRPAARRSGVELTLEIAEALYVGLVTDTGKFMYENTGPRAHRMAAELLDAGRRRRRRSTASSTRTSRRPSSSCSSRGLANMQRFDGGALSISHLSRGDYEATGAEEGYSEGVVDHLRALEGTVVAGLVRDLLGTGKEGMRKVSLRASDDRVDVSRIAREQGGGGHRRAAGFTHRHGHGRAGRLPAPRVAAQLASPAAA